MKRILVFAAVLFIATTLNGQPPFSFKYQAVLRDGRGNVKVNTATVISISILKGSATGTSVYSETHNITTDSYGVVNLDVGKGTVTLGNLIGINWGTDSYFIKVMVDGLEMGTSQLHSVPYALYAAKAANEFSGSYNDLANKPALFDGTWLSLSGKPVLTTVATSGSYDDLINLPVLFSGNYDSLINKPVIFDGKYSSLTEKPVIPDGTVTTVSGTAPISVATGTTTPVISIPQASGTINGYLSNTDWTIFNNKSTFDGTWLNLSGKPAFATVATSGSYPDLINKPVIDGSETVIAAGDNITVEGTGTSSTPYVINTGVIHKIGDLYAGGIIFYIDESGKHGLVAALADQGEGGIEWWIDYFDPTISSSRDGLYAGLYNTERIIIDQGEGSYAAKLCADYQDDEGPFGDWYLPSLYELELIYFNLKAEGIGDFTDNYYWSSTFLFLYDNDGCNNYDIMYIDFSNGGQLGEEYNCWGWRGIPAYNVRAIRAF